MTPSGARIDAPRATDTNAGRLAAAAWLFARGFRPLGRTWEVEIGLDVAGAPATIAFNSARATRLQIYIYSDEWGFRFCHEGLESWIRITDIPFVHGRDEHRLLSSAPPLKALGAFVRQLESRHGVSFQRRHAAVATSIPDSEAGIRSWLSTL